MSITDKLMFWKKKSEFDLDSISDDPMNFNPSTDPMGSPNNPTTDPFATENPLDQSAAPAPGYNPSEHKPQAFGQAKTSQPTITRRDLELLSSKLDTIKALLASLDQRLGVVEQIARAEQLRMQKEQPPKNHLW